MFCVKYYPSESYLREADEFKITYRPADRTLEAFLEEYSDKSIVIDVNDNFDDLDADLFAALYEKYKNFKLIIAFNNTAALEKIKEKNLPFFFSNFACSIDEVHGLIKYHPSDMYICEELGFFLDKVSKILHDNNIKVRVIPNICQSSFPETPAIKQFFIRPEDVPTYAVFVDVFELVVDHDRQKTLLNIYKKEKWRGKIKEIIPSFKGELDGKYILSTFGMIRSKCGKRCLYKPGSCAICDRFIELADTFKENQFVIKKAKKVN